jgi:hypothetical protein
MVIVIKVLVVDFEALRSKGTVNNQFFFAESLEEVKLWLPVKEWQKGFCLRSKARFNCRDTTGKFRLSRCFKEVSELKFGCVIW